MSVTKYQTMSRKIPEERRTQKVKYCKTKPIILADRTK